MRISRRTFIKRTALAVGLLAIKPATLLLKQKPKAIPWGESVIRAQQDLIYFWKHLEATHCSPGKRRCLDYITNLAQSLQSLKKIPTFLGGRNET